MYAFCERNCPLPRALTFRLSQERVQRGWERSLCCSQLRRSWGRVTLHADAVATARLFEDGIPVMLTATVVAIHRYPIKSMRGEALDSVEIGWQGPAGDRRYAFVQAAGGRSQFPWLTAREYPALMTYQPVWEVGEGRPRLRVRCPDGDLLAVDDPALKDHITEGSGRLVYLLGDHRGNYDVAHVSIISTATIRRICEEAGVPVAAARFRGNIIVELSEDTPFAEEQWVGNVVQLGSARAMVAEPDVRCVMITRDPAGGESTPTVSRAATELNGNRAGVYCTVVAPGLVAVGDVITVC